jgi:hypothetical protein
MPSGGASQSTTQKTSNKPWKPAIPQLRQLLRAYGDLNTDPTKQQLGTMDDYWRATQGLPNFGNMAAGGVRGMLSASTDDEQAMLRSGYGDLQTNLGGIAAGEGLNPYETPGFSDALNTMTSDITDRVKGVYAGSGRSPSGAGSFAGSLGRGLTEGIAPVISQQFNANRGAQMSAANSLFSGANTAATGGAELERAEADMIAQGMGLMPNVHAAYLAPSQTQMQAANARYQLPFQNLSQMLGPIMGLGGMGGTSTGHSTTTQAAGSPWGNIIGGGLGLLSLFGGSDERAKEDIERVGKLDDGQPIYRYRFKDSPQFEIGLLAQKVAKRIPRAVASDPDSGMLMVNYKTATERAAQHRRAA